MSKIGENMVLGIGIDIIEIARVERALQRRRSLLGRLFTPPEIAYCLDRGRPEASLAARFAAKEAVRKACSSAIPGEVIPWLEVEIDMDKGHPMVNFLGKTAQKAVANGVRDVFVSLSHSEEYACASVVLSGDQ
ncbi:MAG: holo-ACP synthase [Syntrophaceticus sp.]|nr:holo-ACP synthase [Syntrophaceticus sp.]MDD4783527.1 holo-ACP synthase [Syntrophaceticus sp.]HBI26496.1 holo-[acyl-carrier-protein] synthase [Peptococcaceae bacterium]